MARKEYKKNCTQVVIPEVDNSSPCDDFILSECVIVDRISPYIKNVEGGTLNEYHELQENKMRIMENEIKKLKKIITFISTNLPEIGIGIYED